MKRLFTGIKIKQSDKIYNVLDEFNSTLAGEQINWVKKENLHITLKFFGNTPIKEIPVIKQSLQTVANNCDSFQISINGCGTFGSSKFPRVIWLGINPEPKLISLYKNLNETLAEKGYEQENRNFSPHLTLGRIKHINNKHVLDSLINKYQDELFLIQDIFEFCLFESILEKNGPKYRVLETFNLK